MRKIVINKCFGGFGLSELALTEYLKLSTLSREQLSVHSIARDDTVLVKIVEDLGDQSWGDHSELKIIEIPSDVEWQIDEYDGIEWVAECHRTWK